MDISKAIELSAALSTALAFLIAIGTYRKTVNWRIEDEKNINSKFNMDMAIEGYTRVYDLLSDRNNLRERWIMAARTLCEAQKLESQMTNEGHRAAFDLKKMEIRNSLYETLSIRDPESGERESLPPAFFYGASDWETTSTLDAARDATNPISTHSRTSYENTPSGKLKMLDRSSVIAIFSFLDYPENYNDPLDNVEDNIDHWRPFGLKQGPRNYIRHRNDHVVTSGMCYQNNDEAQEREEWMRVHNEPPPE